MSDYTTPREMREWHTRRQARLEEIEADRQREADRLASLANPPKVDRSRCNPQREQYFITCPLGTPGCQLKHDGSDPIPAEVLEARIAANQAMRKRDGEHRQD